jgi:hypothetical protein
MAEVVRETRVVDEDRGAVDTRSPLSFVARIVYLISGIITTLLALRFILVLLGANPDNGFANFIYSLSQPLVAPFFGLFNYTANLGVARFEFETLIAIIVYSLLAWIIVRILSIGSSAVD